MLRSQDPDLTALECSSSPQQAPLLGFHGHASHARNHVAVRGVSARGTIPTSVARSQFHRLGRRN